MNLKSYLEVKGLSQQQFAQSIGVSQGLIHQWIKGIRRVSAEKVIPITLATNGTITPYQLRPDIYPDPDWLPNLCHEKCRRRS